MTVCTGSTRLCPPCLDLDFISYRRITNDPPPFVRRGGYVALTASLKTGGEQLVPSLTSFSFSHVLPGGNGLVFKLFRDSSLKPILVLVALVESDQAHQSTKLVDRPGIARLLDTRSTRSSPLCC